MSTPCTIVVAVRPSDIGKIKKCNPKLIAIRTEEQIIERAKEFGFDDVLKYDPAPSIELFNEKIKRVKLKPYLSVYHHWDGGPANMSEELLTKYNTYETALNLVLGGFYSTIQEGAMPYSALERCKDIPWKDFKPEGFVEVPNPIYNFQYLFCNGQWSYRKYGDEMFKILKRH